MHTLISSLENSHIKETVHLRERHWRNKSSLFLIEGYRELLRAQEGGVALDRLFICPELFLGSNEDRLIAAIQNSGTKVFTCTEKVFRKISYRDRPDGLLAIAPQYTRDLAFLEQAIQNVSSPLLLVAEAIEKPGNLGTILRSADAAGVHGVIICNRCTDLFNPNVIRASTGILFCLPIVEATTAQTLTWLKKQQINILAARPQATKCYTDIDMVSPVAIVVGTEQLGLSDSWQTEESLQVRIPMNGKADSLNVAQATTLLLYEAVRQRAS